MTLNEAVTKRINEYCNQRNITLNKLCTLSGITQSTVNNIISGKTTNPTILTIYNLCLGLQIPVMEFFNSPLFADTNID
jgi:transcriptional regulator with XRE-family HTH domain